MNKNLTKEIVLHIFNVLGISRQNFISCISDDFLAKKKLIIQDDDGDISKTNIWSSKACVSNSIFKFLTADLEDGDFVLLIQMDEFMPFGIKYGPFDSYVRVYLTSKWINADIATQAKLLAGIEDLLSSVIKLDVLEDFDFLYSTLESFIVNE